MSYEVEVSSLEAVRESSSHPIEPALRRRVLEILDGRSVVAVGNGGTIPAAELFAQLYVSTSGQSATVATSLEYLESIEHRTRSVVVVFSARAKHPDTALAIQNALALQIPVILVTARRRDELGVLSDSRIEVVTVGHTKADGFLATGSLLSMCLAVAAIFDAPVPSAATTTDELRSLRAQLLVLHSWITRPAARDLETRLNELGLAAVQLSDYRNFAHGRHVGLARRLDSTTIVALVEPSVEGLAEKTLKLIPTGADVRVVRSAAGGVAGAIDILTQVMVAPLGFANTEDPAKPRVPAFGRRLYHLPYRSMFRQRPLEVAQLKALACRATTPNQALVDHYTASFRKWRSEVASTTVHGLVLDWDGTCVETAGRWLPPSPEVQRSLLDALGSGLMLTVATGRGDSLWHELRTWIPRSLWPLVQLELHNGAWQQPLEEDLRQPPASTLRWQAELNGALEPFIASGQIAVRNSSTQISLTPTRPEMSVEDVFAIVIALVNSAEATAAMSGHSVDVIDSTHGKHHALSRAELRCGTVLAIGDQGGPGGNDFRLLHSTRLSLSVDRVSASADACWRIDVIKRGPDGLVNILDRLKSTSGGVRLKV